jgi:hypothetical protein
MKEKGIIPSYIIAALLLVLIGVGALTAKALKDASAALDIKLGEVTRLSDQPYELRGQNAMALRAAVPVHDIKVYSKHEVTMFILQYADYLNEKYDAEIEAPLVDDFRALSAPITFTLNFNRFQPFSDMLDELLAQRQPMVYINSMNLELSNEELNSYTLNMKAELSMPYVSAEDAASMQQLLMENAAQEAANEEQ